MRINGHFANIESQDDTMNSDSLLVKRMGDLIDVFSAFLVLPEELDH
jgi:hypothetical protein